MIERYPAVYFRSVSHKMMSGDVVAWEHRLRSVKESSAEGPDKQGSIHSCVPASYTSFPPDGVCFKVSISLFIFVLSWYFLISDRLVVRGL